MLYVFWQNGCHANITQALFKITTEKVWELNYCELWNFNIKLKLHFQKNLLVCCHKYFANQIRKTKLWCNNHPLSTWVIFTFVPKWNTPYRRRFYWYSYFPYVTNQVLFLWTTNNFVARSGIICQQYLLVVYWFVIFC